MESILTAKEQPTVGTPLLLFDCTLADGHELHWSSRTIDHAGAHYEGRVLRHNIFEAQAGSDTQIGGAPRLTFELANADSALSQIEQEIGFKGARLLVHSAFAGVSGNTIGTDSIAVFSGLMNPPDLITETAFRLSAINRMSTQRSILPEVRIQRLCPWRFPMTESQRREAVDGGVRFGKYSPFFRCGYSPDQPGGCGNLNGDKPFADCAHSRSDCEARGMFRSDSSGRNTARFGGIEFVPPTILVRGSGQKSWSLSAVQDNLARYNNFVPLIYGTQWHAPDVVFSRNDGNLTRMEVLLGMGEIQGVLKVLVNNIEIPRGVTGTSMTSSGWYNLISPGSRSGAQDPDFTDGHGTAAGDPYGTMAYLSVVVPNCINDGTSIPSVQVLLQGMKLEQFDGTGQPAGAQFSDNPAWVMLDVLRRSGFALDEIDVPSFVRAAGYAGELIDAQDPLGGTVTIPRFQCNFAMKSRRSSGEIIRAIRNASRLYLVLNGAGKIEIRVENTFALQQPSKGAGSNALEQFNGGWPAYEFDARSIARMRDGAANIQFSSRNAQDTPNRLSVEFQDAFNQFQHDSLSLADGDDTDLCGQEVAASWDAAGISTFHQAARMLLLGLNRAISGNVFVEFETSVKALGLMPGDLITVSYEKENLQRAPFRILKIAPGAGFRTAVITAQAHDDAWYSDAITGITGGRGWQSGAGAGLPAPVGGTVRDEYGNLQLGISESGVDGTDGSSLVQLSVAFEAPSGRQGHLAAPLVDLIGEVKDSGGSLPGGRVWYYAISTVDSAGGESAISFMIQVATGAASDENSVLLKGIGLAAGATGFHVYRGESVHSLARIAENQVPATSFIDRGLPYLTSRPPDPQFDHVNVYWRWELTPEMQATIHSPQAIGNDACEWQPGAYIGSSVRITRGRGLGQEAIVVSSDENTLDLDRAWNIVPDATSWFAIAENSWHIGASGPASPIVMDVPERAGTGLQISARAANVKNAEAAYETSPVGRWVIGQSGDLLTDMGAPPCPLFAADISSTRGGTLELGPVAFSNLQNTRRILAGTCRIHYYDELAETSKSSLQKGLTQYSLEAGFDKAPPEGTLLQIGAELLKAGRTDNSGNTAIERGQLKSPVAGHEAGENVYQLKERISVFPFTRNFFGTPASGDWRHTVEIPCARIGSVELSLTNALGEGAAGVNCYTGTLDQGLRTLSGGQFTFQVSGFLASVNGATPPVTVDKEHSVRDVFARLGTPSAGAGVSLQLNRNDEAFCTLQIEAGESTSNVVNGFGLPPLRAGDLLSLDVNGVGTIRPGSDLTVTMRL
jgi:hypothetical protein